MTKTAKLYQPAKTAMQSGTAKTEKWLLEFTPTEKKTIDNLMGWQGSGDTKQQIKLFFDTKEEGLAYANKHNLSVDVKEPKKPTLKIKSYTENFTK